MSIKVMFWVWENGPKDPTERLTLLALADWADDAGSCYPSMIGIAEKTGVTERGARGIVRRLEASGWITIKTGGGRGGKNIYRVLMVKPGTSNPEPETGNMTETRNVTTQNPERDCTKPGTTVPPNRQEPSGNRQRPRETEIVVVKAEQDSRREQVLSLMGCSKAGVTPEGRFTGTTSDLAELPKWDALQLSHSEQDAKIREMLDKQRRKVPGFMPNTWGWFTAGMNELARAKKAPASPRHDTTQSETPEQRQKRRKRLIGR